MEKRQLMGKFLQFFFRQNVKKHFYCRWLWIKNSNQKHCQQLLSHRSKITSTNDNHMKPKHHIRLKLSKARPHLEHVSIWDYANQTFILSNDPSSFNRRFPFDSNTFLFFPSSHPLAVTADCRLQALNKSQSSWQIHSLRNRCKHIAFRLIFIRMESNHLSRILFAFQYSLRSLDCIETRFKHSTNINQGETRREEKNSSLQRRWLVESLNNINFSLAPLSILINDNLVEDVMFELGPNFLPLTLESTES